MNARRVYLLSVLIFLGLGTTMTGCARKSGCHALEQTTKPAGKNAKASTHLFGAKTRRKMGG